MSSSNLYLRALRNVSDVLLNGASVLDKRPIEARVGVDGYVVLEDLLEEDDATTEHNKLVGKQIIDGQVLTVHYFGNVEVVP
jgi:hypothetical protein